jgi:choline dehydrogenase
VDSLIGALLTIRLGTIATNLARAGHSVLLIEAGSDATADIRTQILSLNSFSNEGVTWHFFVRHSDDEERTKRYNLMVWRLASGEYWVGRDPTVDGHGNATRLGIFYPRGATLGGSAIVNAAVTFLPSDSDWDYFDRGVGDGVWKYEFSVIGIRTRCTDFEQWEGNASHL